MSVINLNESNIGEAIEGAGITVLDWWAPWCGPCRSFAPTFEAVAAAHPEAVFAKVNTEESPSLGAAFQIRSIPTLMIFRDGIMVFSQAGMVPKKALEDILAQVVALDMAEVRREIEKAKTKTVPDTAVHA